MTMLPQQPAMFSWQQPLAALFGGLSAAGQPGGLANFGAGVNQTMQAQSQQAQQQQIAELRRMQIEQAQMEMNRANTADAQRQATAQRIAAMFGGGGVKTASGAQPGQPAMINPVRPVGNYGAAVGGAPQPAMLAGSEMPQSGALPAGGDLPFGFNQDQAALFMALPVEQQVQVLTERGFAQPERDKWETVTVREGNEEVTYRLNPYTGDREELGRGAAFKPEGAGIQVDTNGDGVPDITIGGAGMPKLTEAQSKDTGWAARLDGAITDMAAAESSGYDPTAGGATMDYIGQRNIGGLLGNILTSDQGKQWYRGAKEALAVILRKDSGGAITPEEFKMYGPIYLPMPWDDPQTKTAKNQALQTTLGALKTTSGGGYDVNKARSDAQTPPPAPAPAPDAPAPAPQQTELPIVNSPEEAAKLPKGTKFRDPKGVVRVVP
jgi:hypothetical protein